jgi:hypothetical protein
LKARWLAAHNQLADYKKVEKLSQIPGLVEQKPPELLATMPKLCLRGQAKMLLYFYYN